MIRDALAGRRIAITGSTGFLGTAIVERLLRSVPDSELVLLVRAGRTTSPQRRAGREVFRNDAFDRLRGDLGDRFDDEVARRVTVIGGDVGSDGLGLDEEGRAAFTGCDVVIHAAATVSFDSPLDGAVEVNLLGPQRVAQTLAGAVRPAHLVSVSTCYVAANHRGAAPERLLPGSTYFPEVTWAGEVEAARRTRGDTDAASRDPGLLARLRKSARSELGAAGTPLLAAKTEKLREQWVADRMVEAGRSRARSLGWPDVYSFTKALGEVALLERRGPVPVTILRPSIIESALTEPRPGWIRGFRMTDPVIIAYARGLLREFPGIPEGIVDVIPVDYVAAAICAAAAEAAIARDASADTSGTSGTSRSSGEPAVYQVASGAANPLRYRRLVDLGRDYFTANPIYDNHGQPILVPEWSFPGRGRVQNQLQRAKNGLERAERLLAMLPLRGRQAEWSARIEEKRIEADRALGYVEIYGSYAETEAVFGVDRLLELAGRLDEADRQAFSFDPRTIDWEHYVYDVHLPAVVTSARVKTTAGARTATARADRLRAAVLHRDRHLAAFDLENTLIASNVVDSYSWLATRRMALPDRLRFVARTLAEAPGLLALDKADRGDFLRHFYRRYDNAPVTQLDEDAAELFSQLILTKSFPAGIRRIREHRALGHRTVLITGALDFIVEPLRPLFDDIVCARMGVAAGAYTGELDQVPPTGEARAIVLADYTAAEGLRLDESIAYADSASDLPMLEAVGFPVAVNPETRLSAIARKRGWLVEHWAKAPGGPRPPLPIPRAVHRPPRAAGPAMRARP